MEKHKRYLLFAHSTYYPGGGLNDLVGSYNSVLEAVHAASEIESDYKELYDRLAGEEIDLSKFNVIK